MQKRLSFLMLSWGLLIGVLPTLAQEQSGCFWKDNNGKSVDLGELCPKNNPSPLPHPTQVNSTPSGIFRIPIKRRESGVPIIDVIFNGKRSYEMAFDTGASWITITPEMAKSLKVKPERKAFLSTANGNVVLDVGKIASVQAGLIVQKNLFVVISPGLSSIGLLGQNFFGQHDVTIKANEIIINLRDK